MAAVARIGDTSSHGGSIISGSSDTIIEGSGAARAGDAHSCPLSGHGITSLVPITVKTYVNGQLVITIGAHAGCGATITSGASKTNAE